MSKAKFAFYDTPHEFEPLLPSEGVAGPLRERASDLIRAATALVSTAAPEARRELRALLRRMNSYYTNKLEGEQTRPFEIDAALAQDFSAKPELARKQRLAVAHIVTEEMCERLLESRGNDGRTWLYTQDALRSLHEHLFSGLSEEDRRLEDGSLMTPGAFRQRNVKVGRHVAPSAVSLDAFLTRWCQVYGAAPRGEAGVISALASHHRLAWIHAFPDGNGRVTRLHTHLALHAMALTGGLWSPLRGYARTEGEYRRLLADADMPRRGALDGRGQLTQQGLMDWIRYSLDMCIDQIEFMRKMLDTQTMKGRIETALLIDEKTRANGVRPEAAPVLHYLFAADIEMDRGQFKTMTGLGKSVATNLLSALLREGYLASDSPYGKVRFSIPRHALGTYFPALWPEAEQDQALLQAEHARSTTDKKRSLAMTQEVADAWLRVPGKAPSDGKG